MPSLAPCTGVRKEKRGKYGRSEIIGNRKRLTPLSFGNIFGCGVCDLPPVSRASRFRREVFIGWIRPIAPQRPLSRHIAKIREIQELFTGFRLLRGTFQTAAQGLSCSLETLLDGSPIGAPHDGFFGPP